MASPGHKELNYVHWAVGTAVNQILTPALERIFTGGRQLPSAAITISQHGELRCRYGKIFAVHIKHTFLGLGFVYDRMSCMHLLNTAI